MAARLRRLDEIAEIIWTSCVRPGDLPRDRAIHVICRSDQRVCYATRILLQNGFNARNISGGMLSHDVLLKR